MASIWDPAAGGATVNANNTLQRQRFTAAEGQTDFTLTEFSYVPNTGSTILFYNGSAQQIPVDYTELSASVIKLTFACNAGDIVDVIGFTGVSAIVDNIRLFNNNVIATAEQTQISTAVTYRAGTSSTALYKNGVRLIPGVDYTETDNASFLTLTTPAAGGETYFSVIGQLVNDVGSDAALISYTPSGTGAAATTVEDILRAQLMVDYMALRDYTGLAKTVRITGLLVTAQPQGIAGFFQFDETDTTSADNGGTIIVGADGRRWKRVYTGLEQWGWFGVKGDGVTDDWAALANMINSVGVIAGVGGAFAISQSLPITEDLLIAIDDIPGAIAGGAFLPHSSVVTPSTFDYFFNDRKKIDSVQISGVRFLRGRHVINSNTPSGVSDGFIANVNFNNCVFQELDGYVINASNSVFVIDFELCRLIRCGGVNSGYGTNILRFRSSTFENMRREYIKLTNVGSSLPSASIGLFGCRCEGVEDVAASKCFDITGEGRLFNFQIADGTYFENVFTNIGTISGVRSLNLSDINFTNSDLRVYQLTLTDSTVSMLNVQSLVDMQVRPQGTTVLNNFGGNSSSITFISSGSARLSERVESFKTIETGGATTPLFNFTVASSGQSGATVFALTGGRLILTLVTAKTNDGTPIYFTKEYLINVRKMFGGTVALTSTEVASDGSLSDTSIAIATVSADANGLVLGVTYTTPTGTFGSGVAVGATFLPAALSALENTIMCAAA